MSTYTKTSFIINLKLKLLVSLGVVVNSSSQVKLIWQTEFLFRCHSKLTVVKEPLKQIVLNKKKPICEKNLINLVHKQKTQEKNRKFLFFIKFPNKILLKMLKCNFLIFIS